MIGFAAISLIGGVYYVLPRLTEIIDTQLHRLSPGAETAPHPRRDTGSPQPARPALAHR